MSKLKFPDIKNLKDFELTSENYTVWKKRIANLLDYYEVLECINPEKKKDARSNKLARQIILANLNSNDVNFFIDFELAHEIWDAIGDKYSGSIGILQLKTWRQIMEMKVDSDKSVTEFVNLLDQWQTMSGVAIPPILAADTLMGSLDQDKCESIINDYANSEDSDKTIEKVIGNVKNKLERIATTSTINSPVQSSTSFAAINRLNRRQPPKCFNCGGTGHIAKNCFKRNNKSNNFASTVTEPVVNCSMNASNKTDNEWYVDSAASFHYTGNIEKLRQLRETDSKVMTANGEISRVTMMGKTTIGSKHGDDINLNDVRYVPGFRNNLLSVPVVCDKGNLVLFDEKKCLFLDKRKANISFDKSAINLVASRENNSYIVKSASASNSTETAFSTDVLNWHRRMGHAGPEKLSRMLNDNSAKNYDCQECRLSKNTRVAHKPVFENFNLMERISADVMGPFPESFEGHRYVLHLVEHHTSMGGVYLLKTKSEVVNNVIDFVTYCENQTETKLKQFFSDNGSEFVNHFLRTHFEKKGVAFLNSAPYTPQQNGKIERRNRTLIECARTMMNEAELPIVYWSLAVMAANYLINRWPTKGGIIPIAKFMKKEISYDHHKVFGCLAYSRINDVNKANKFDRTGRKMIFVGYTSSTKNYKLLDPLSKTIVTTCDVYFDETKMGYPLIIAGGTKPDRNFDLPNHALTAASDSSIVPYDEALNSKDRDEWLKAMDKELTGLIQKGVYHVVDQSQKKPLSTKWVLKRKDNGQYKARLVVRGFEQFDVDNTFAPTLNMATLRVVLSLALTKHLVIKQLDISSAFLNSDLDGDIYVTPPKESNDKCWKLKKALYGLKQAPRAWYGTIRKFMIEQGLKCSLVDPCLFYNEKFLILLYVDDIIICANNDCEADNFVENLSLAFDLHDYGDPNKFVGMNLNIGSEEISIDMTKHIHEALQRFGMTDCNPTVKPMDDLVNFSQYEVDNKYPVKELLGSLNYIAVMARPDISFCVNYLSRFADKPSYQLWVAAKRVLRYLKGSLDWKLTIRTVNDWTIKTYTDASFRSDCTSHSTAGVLVMIGENALQWSSKKLNRLMHSTCEAELTAALNGWKLAAPIKQLLNELNVESHIKILCDSSSAVSIMNNQSFKNSRYFEYDQKVLVSKLATDGAVLERVPTKNQLADFLTKPNAQTNFNTKPK
ncbi:hypothetical protein BLOT_015699 [Blomia tropicalis]|nr:hypothetical protein BLOT_015699 [Blomia tropicalis]